MEASERTKRARQALRQDRISKRRLTAAIEQCTARGALPEEGPDLSVIPLLAPVAGSDVTTYDIVEYVVRRIKEDSDPGRFREAAHLLLILFFLDSPAAKTIITTKYD